jgi:hypothetical protein
MVDPFRSAVGQGTRAYVQLRQPFLNLVLLASDERHPEWEAAVAELHEVAAWAGFSLVEDVRARQLADSIRANLPDASAAAADPVPSMAEVLAIDKANMEDLKLQQQPVVVEDYRRPGPPRQVEDRPYMQPPARLRDLRVR